MPTKMTILGTGLRDVVTAEQFGNKAAMLARIGALSIQIPAAFVLSVSVCEDYFANHRKLPDYVPDLIETGLHHLEKVTDLRFGLEPGPLLVSVRSGAPISMPGMMSTVLDVGLNEQGVRALIAQSGNPRFGWDCYRRLISSYAEIVAHQEPERYDRALADKVHALGVNDVTELDSKALWSLSDEYGMIYKDLEGSPFPQDPNKQLYDAVSAIFESWASPRAEEYRQMNSIKGARGTAVTIQTMVFGNMGYLSGSGVAFTRNPWTGKREVVIDFRFGTQGEDVVSGEQEANQEGELKRLLPQVYKELQFVCNELESSMKEMQDIEFTVQEGDLYILQTRGGEMSPLATIRVAVDLADEGIITREEALDRIEGIDLRKIAEQKTITERPLLARGTSASLGIVTGEIVLSKEAAIERATYGPVILMRDSLTPDDITGVSASAGIITVHGNRMAHAIVVARRLNKACILNVQGLAIDLDGHSFTLKGKKFEEGTVMSMDSGTGDIFEGRVMVVNEKPVDLLTKIKGWKKDLASSYAKDHSSLAHGEKK